MVSKAKRSADRRASIAAEVPIELYEHARRRLLVHEPMIGYAVQGSSAAQALTAGEIDALESVGLSTAAWAGGVKQDRRLYGADRNQFDNDSGRRLFESRCQSGQAAPARAIAVRH